MKPWNAPITGNIVWTVSVAAIASVVIIPMWRGELSIEALSTLATAAMATLSALCMAAAGFAWRGKIEAQAAGTGTGGNGGTTTTTIPQTPPAAPIIVTTTPTGTVTDTGKDEPRVSPLDT